MEKTLEARVEALFDEMARAFTEARLRDMIDCYDPPVAVHRAIRSTAHADLDSLLGEAMRVRERYLQLGLARSHARVVRVLDRDPGLILVDVDWTHYRADGSEIVTINNTYALRRLGESFRVAVHISHNEMERRPMFVSAESSAEEIR